LNQIKPAPDESQHYKLSIYKDTKPKLKFERMNYSSC